MDVTAPLIPGGRGIQSRLSTVVTKTRRSRFRITLIISFFLSLFIFITQLKQILAILFNPPPPPPVSKFQEPVLNQRFDLFVTSFYYYRRSVSLGNNHVAIIFTGPVEALNLNHLHAEARNETHVIRFPMLIKEITMPDKCNWTARMIRGTTLPNMLHFEFVLDDQRIPMPFKEPSKRKFDVVTCVSPIFASEQWQNFVFAAHIYRKFGSHMHIYVRSAMTSMMKMMKVYEKAGYVTIQPWARISLSTVPVEHFNPNRQAGNRNQNGAQNDCLLQYKESAQWIVMVDLDDVLIPRKGDFYLDEFNYFLSTRPYANYLWYHKRNVELRAQRDPDDFSLSQMISSFHIREDLEFGKSVIQPRYVHSTWIHHPVGIWGMLTINATENYITHLRFKDDDHAIADNKTIIERPYLPPNQLTNDTRPMLSRKVIRWIQDDFEAMLRRPDMRDVWSDMPKMFLYFEIISGCFYEKLYKAYFKHKGSSSIETCTGVEMCTLPKLPGVVCSNADADYFSSTNSSLINIHYWANERFVVQDICIR